MWHVKRSKKNTIVSLPRETKGLHLQLNISHELTSRLELLVVGVRLPLVKPASMDLVFKEACSFGSCPGGIRWGGTLGLYSTVRL